MNFVFSRKSVFPKMIFWGSDFLRFLIFAFSILICYFQCKLSEKCWKLSTNLIIESETSKPCNLIRKSCLVLILQRIGITSLTNPYNHIKTDYETLQFFLGETQINRILAPCHTWKYKDNTAWILRFCILWRSWAYRNGAVGGDSSTSPSSSVPSNRELLTYEDSEKEENNKPLIIISEIELKNSGEKKLFLLHCTIYPYWKLTNS